MNTPTITYANLTKEIATTHAEEIVTILNYIPLVTTSKDALLADQKDTRRLLHKWEYSRYAYDEETNNIVGVLIAYHRTKEENQHYPEDSTYINELAVLPSYQQQGLGTTLLRQFINDPTLTTPTITVQTNSAPWNEHVQGFYKKMGFVKRGEKPYPDRVDVILEYHR